MKKSNAFAVLTEAVERYVNTEEYPKVEVICAILGIEIKKERESNGKHTRV